MGRYPQMTKIRLRYIHKFIDRHGKVRCYVHLPGRKRVPLPGAPGTAEFMEAYQAALTGEVACAQVGAARTAPGTIDAAVVSYFSSSAFASLAPETRRVRRNILERFRAEHGDKRVALLQRAHIDRMVAAKVGTPSAARNFLDTIRAPMRHCLDQGWRVDDPTQGVKRLRIKTEGFRTWTEADIAAFEAVHSVGTRARLRSPCCSIPRNAARTLCALADDMSETALSRCAIRKWGWSLPSLCTLCLRRF